MSKVKVKVVSEEVKFWEEVRDETQNDIEAEEKKLKFLKAVKKMAENELEKIKREKPKDLNNMEIKV